MRDPVSRKTTAEEQHPVLSPDRECVATHIFEHTYTKGFNSESFCKKCFESGYVPGFQYIGLDILHVNHSLMIGAVHLWGN